MMTMMRQQNVRPKIPQLQMLAAASYAKLHQLTRVVTPVLGNDSSLLRVLLKTLPTFV